MQDNYEHEVLLDQSNYINNGNLALTLIDASTHEPVISLTVNLGEALAPDETYLDTNNFPEAEEFIEKYNLGKPAGKTQHSGYCEYPLYKFDMKKLEKWSKV